MKHRMWTIEPTSRPGIWSIYALGWDDDFKLIRQTAYLPNYDVAQRFIDKLISLGTYVDVALDPLAIVLSDKVKMYP